MPCTRGTHLSLPLHVISKKVEFLKGNFQRSCKGCARFSNENHVIKIRAWLLHVKMLFLYIHAQVDTEFFCPFPISFFYNSRPIHNGMYRTLQFYHTYSDLIAEQSVYWALSE